MIQLQSKSRRRLEAENLFLRHQLNIALMGAPHPSVRESRLPPQRAALNQFSILASIDFVHAT
jgi:hypothetical protein